MFFVCANIVLLWIITLHVWESCVCVQCIVKNQLWRAMINNKQQHFVLLIKYFGTRETESEMERYMKEHTHARAIWFLMQYRACSDVLQHKLGICYAIRALLGELCVCVFVVHHVLRIMNTPFVRDLFGFYALMPFKWAARKTHHHGICCTYTHMLDGSEGDVHVFWAPFCP